MVTISVTVIIVVSAKIKAEDTAKSFFCLFYCTMFSCIIPLSYGFILVLSWGTGFFYKMDAGKLQLLLPITVTERESNWLETFWTVPVFLHKMVILKWLYGTFYAPNFEEWRGILLLGYVSVHPFVTLFDACHTLWTMHARVLKFHIWIPQEKIADPYYYPANLYILSYPHFNTERNVVSKIFWKLFELEAWNLVSW